MDFGGQIISGNPQPLVVYLPSTSGSAGGYLADLQIFISKNLAASVVPTGAVSAFGQGFYAVAPNSTDSSTVGPLVVTAQFVTPPSPVVSGVAGGTIGARSESYQITYFGPQGETSPSAITIYSVGADNLAFITSPVAAYNYTGYNVYGLVGGQYWKQNGTPVAIGTSWTEPTTGLVGTGSNPPATPTASPNLYLVQYQVINASTSNGAGTGAYTVTFTVTDNAATPNLLQNVVVSATLNNTIYQAVSNQYGVVTFNLNSGVYTIAAALPGYAYGGSKLTVTGNQTAPTLSLSPITTTFPPYPNMCTLTYLYLNSVGIPQVGATFNYQIISPPNNTTYNGLVQTSPAANSGGVITLSLPQGAWVLFTIGTASSVSIQIPLLVNASLNSLISLAMQP